MLKVRPISEAARLNSLHEREIVVKRKTVRPNYEVVVASRIVLVIIAVALVFDVRSEAVWTAVEVAAINALKSNEIRLILFLAEIALICLVVKRFIVTAGLFRFH